MINLKLEDFEGLVPCAMCGHDTPKGGRDVGVSRLTLESHTVQGSLTEGEVSVHLTSLYLLV
jgi:hypothetical protein